MAPEVALGRSADARSDIYSLGCVLYELLTGRPPFLGDLAVAVMNQHTSIPPQPPREFDPAISAGLEALVLEVLAKEPADSLGLGAVDRMPDSGLAMHSITAESPMSSAASCWW